MRAAGVRGAREDRRAESEGAVVARTRVHTRSGSMVALGSGPAGPCEVDCGERGREHMRQRPARTASVLRDTGEQMTRADNVWGSRVR